MQIYGMDVGKYRVKIIGTNPDTGKTSTSTAFYISRENLCNFRDSIESGSTVAMESSSNTWAIYKILSQREDIKVLVANPVAIRLIAQSVIKTDEIDATIISQLARLGYFPHVYCPTEEEHLAKQLISTRSSLVKIIVSIKNQIHNLLSRNLIRYKFGDLFGKKGMQFLRDIELPQIERFQLNCFIDILEHISKQKEEIERKILPLAGRDKRTKLIMTISGIGPISAFAIANYIGDIKRFPTPKKLASYFGLTPRIYQSGQKSYTGRITKRGNRKIRSILIECANIAVRKDSPLRSFYLRIRAKKGHNVAVCAVARKLLNTIWHILSKEERFYYTDDTLYQTKISRLEKVSKDESV